MKVLLAHEWLARHGGSENVFEEMSKALPEADRVCLWNDAPGRFTGDVRETWLARSPLRRSKALALPFMSAAWRAVEIGDYEQVVVSSHAFSHHLAARAAIDGIDSYAYVHTPARYVWAPELDTRGASAATRAAARLLKRVDRRNLSDSVSYAANSEFVKSRMRRCWGVDASVIYPPVSVHRIQEVDDWRDKLAGAESDFVAGLPADFVLGASRLVDYKRLDLVMEIGSMLGLPVVIAGDGPEAPRLKALAAEAPVPVIFAGRVSDALLYSLYQRALLFVFLPIEDFGIMPVEAMAAGTPVLVNNVGGAAESVRMTGGGQAVDISSNEDMRAGAESLIGIDKSLVRDQSRYFDEANFRERIRSWTGDSGISND